MPFNGPHVGRSQRWAHRHRADDPAECNSSRAYEAREDVFAVSINAGFASADIKEVGPTVLVTRQGDLAAHSTFAETIADDIWDKRYEVLNDYLTVEEAAEIATTHDSNRGPL